MNPESHVFPKNLQYNQAMGVVSFSEIWQRAKAGKNFWPLLAIAVLLGVILLGSGIATGNVLHILGAPVYFVVVGCAAYFGFKSDILFERFARANNLVSITSNTPIAELRGVLTDAGDDVGFERGFADPAGKWLVANVQFSTGSGKNRTEHTFGVIRMKLPRNVPNVLLEATGNNFFNQVDLASKLTGQQTLQLEGDFNKYFRVYVPEGYGRDALYFLTPELMLLLVQQGSMYDYEVLGDELMIYSAEFGGGSETFMSLLQQRFAHAEQLYAEFVDNTRLYNDDRVQEGSPQSVAVQGQVLKRKKTSRFLVYVFYVIFFIIWLVAFGGGVFSALNS